MKGYKENLRKILFGCIFLLLTAEGLLRGAFFVRHMDIKAFDSGYFLYRPDAFTGYSLKPGVIINHPTLHTQNNSLGYRSREFAAKKPEGVYRIIILGGSEAYGHGLSDADTWAEQLQKLFDGDRHRKVEVINAAVDGYSSFQSMISFSTRLLDFSPDLAICYLGWNDIKYRPLLSPEKGFDEAGLAERKETPSMWNRWLHYSYVYIVGKALKNSFPASFLGRLQIKSETPYNPADSKESLNYGKYIFERNIRNIVNIAKGNNIKVVLVNQLNLISNGMQEEKKSKIRFILEEKDLIEALKQTGHLLQRVAEEEKVFYMDLNTIINPDLELLSDHVHTTPKGSRVIAQELYSFLVEKVFYQSDQRSSSNINR
jgi:lysophospholipase L1-like esterase